LLAFNRPATWRLTCGGSPQMNRGTLQLLGGSVCLGAVVLVFTVGVLPIAEALYAYGLWPRLTAQELPLHLKQRYRITVRECSEGTNGWDYICQLPPQRPGVRQFYDKLGVLGSPFGVGVMVELRPGPVPAREDYRTGVTPR